MGLYSVGLIIGRTFASEIWGAFFREGRVILGGAYHRNFTVLLNAETYKLELRDSQTLAMFTCTLQLFAKSSKA